MKLIMQFIREGCSGEKGFTLLELTLAAALLTIVMLSVLSVTIMSQQIFTDNGTYAQLTQGSMQTLRHISREIGQTSPNVTPSHLTITTDGNGNSVVCFQIPVDWDNDGDAVTAGMNPAVEWGAYDWIGQTTNGRLNGWTCYSVNNTQQLVRDVRNSALAPIAGLSSVVTTGVQAFQVTRVTDNLQMTLTLQATDRVGRRGVPQVTTSTFTSTTILRNAVN